MKLTAAQYRARFGKKKPATKAKGRARYAHVKSGWYFVAGTWYYFRSKKEYRFALVLEYWRQTGKIDAWAYEPLKFELWQSKSNGEVIQHFYTPDFCTYFGDYIGVVYEIKGRDFRTGDKLKMKLFDEHPDAHTLELMGVDAWKPLAKAYTFLPLWNAEPITKDQMPEGAKHRPKTRRYQSEEDAYYGSV